MESTAPVPAPENPKARRRRLWAFVAIVVVVAILTAVVTWLLTDILEKKQQAKYQYVKLVNVTEDTTDPAVWGKNWPREYESYQRTVDATHTRYGGSEAMTSQKLERDPWLKTAFAGYAFALDYRDRRGHAYMLSDQLATQRVQQRPQPGACLHCHASIMPLYRQKGEGNVQKGFQVVSAMPYQEAYEALKHVSDGTDNPKPHPVSCVDCHDPDTMNLRVTRPGFINGIKALKAKQGIADYDPNRDATRQEMRSFVCGQCHVEYYCGPKETLLFPWGEGLTVDQIEKFWENHKFPDGTPFYDWQHQVTGAKLFKAQHPEFETWNQGIHARSGVACADCHMPYQRVGAMKVSDHWVRSPLLMLNLSCQPCHRYPEDELRGRVQVIQDKTHNQIQKAAVALTGLINAIALAKANGADEQELSKALEMHRKAQWRLDFVYAENSMGFHASQEVMRILSDSIDYARQGQLEAQRLLLRPTTRPASMPTSIEGVTPTEKSPANPPGR